MRRWWNDLRVPERRGLAAGRDVAEPGPEPGRAFERVAVVVLEAADALEVLSADGGMPTLASLALAGAPHEDDDGDDEHPGHWGAACVRAARDTWGGLLEKAWKQKVLGSKSFEELWTLQTLSAPSSE